jgi:hypothetical protein
VCGRSCPTSRAGGRNSKLESACSAADKTPWIAFSVFTVFSLLGAFLRMGYVDFLPYGFVLWVIAALHPQNKPPARMMCAY